ncbi:hypothetical protein ERJ75_001765400 [Trypanosoma vivax]|uniref:Uncharacterized protein n=1 Tax=Trypanosoma vivax (strain Y486) TaxID=1055687 RepID=G0TRI3_TRYVY|nr:hypothetical protein TRVL_02503 [Trypanosoma vivax]KAH8603987.1 hypothetical protein ERJ75_001765400 [Trypanosoma vivax]CCC46547.1 conserved hypothetical protein [Trypanosoma vivax Y486]
MQKVSRYTSRNLFDDVFATIPGDMVLHTGPATLSEKYSLLASGMVAEEKMKDNASSLENEEGRSAMLASADGVVSAGIMDLGAMMRRAAEKKTEQREEPEESEPWEGIDIQLDADDEAVQEATKYASLFAEIEAQEKDEFNHAAGVGTFASSVRCGSNGIVGRSALVGSGGGVGSRSGSSLTVEEQIAVMRPEDGIRYSGCCVLFRGIKNFGFIAPDVGGPDVYFTREGIKYAFTRRVLEVFYGNDLAVVAENSGLRREGEGFEDLSYVPGAGRAATHMEHHSNDGSWRFNSSILGVSSSVEKSFATVNSGEDENDSVKNGGAPMTALESGNGEEAEVQRMDTTPVVAPTALEVGQEEVGSSVTAVAPTTREEEVEASYAEANSHVVEDEKKVAPDDVVPVCGKADSVKEDVGDHGEEGEGDKKLPVVPLKHDDQLVQRAAALLTPETAKLLLLCLQFGEPVLTTTEKVTFSVRWNNSNSRAGRRLRADNISGLPSNSYALAIERWWFSPLFRSVNDSRSEDTRLRTPYQSASAKGERVHSDGKEGDGEILKRFRGTVRMYDADEMRGQIRPEVGGAQYVSFSGDAILWASFAEPARRHPVHGLMVNYSIAGCDKHGRPVATLITGPDDSPLCEANFVCVATVGTANARESASGGLYGSSTGGGGDANSGERHDDDVGLEKAPGGRKRAREEELLLLEEDDYGIM